MAVVAGGLLAWIPEAVRLGAMVGLGALLVLYDLLVERVRLPQSARQIPEHVFVRDRRWAAVRFGFEYGTGLRTFVTSAAPYLLLLGLVTLSLPPWQVVLAGAAFGLGRSLSLFQYSFRRRDNWQSAVKRQSRLLERAGSLTVYASILAVGSI